MASLGLCKTVNSASLGRQMPTTPALRSLAVLEPFISPPVGLCRHRPWCHLPRFGLSGVVFVQILFEKEIQERADDGNGR